LESFVPKKKNASPEQILNFDRYAESWRYKLLCILETYTKSDFLKLHPHINTISFYYQMFLVFLVLLSTASFVASTEPQFYHNPPIWSSTIDICTVVVFVTDYFGRMFCAYSVINYVKSLYNIFDLLSFLPLISMSVLLNCGFVFVHALYSDWKLNGL